MNSNIKDITNQLKVNEGSELFDSTSNYDFNAKTDDFTNNLDELDENFGRFNIKIFGIGGAGCNVLEHMLTARTWNENVSMYALNTDIKALLRLKGLANSILLGKRTLKGVGSGGDPSIGKISAEENIEEIKSALTNTDILFILAGLGKGTGSGASPVIGKIARELGILTVAVVNFPSINAEGTEIFENANECFENLKANVDSITKISNDKIITNEKNISFMEAFQKANNEVTTSVSEIVDMITNSTNMNLDFADVRNFFKSHKIFMSGSFDVDNDYSIKTLNDTINHSFKQSYSDVNIRTEDVKIILNLKINSKTPSCITNDIRDVFKTLTISDKLTMVHGIDYVNNERVRGAFLISADSTPSSVNENLTKFNLAGSVKDELAKEVDIFRGININLDEYRTKPLSTIQAGVKKETVKFDVDDSALSSNHLNSTDAQKLITKAITNMMGTEMINGGEKSKHSN